MREYIFCSVIESPQIATRSPFFSSKLEYFGAGSGLNFSSPGSVGCCPGARETSAKARSAKRKIGFERIRLIGRILWFQTLSVKKSLHHNSILEPCLTQNRIQSYLTHLTRLTNLTFPYTG